VVVVEEERGLAAERNELLINYLYRLPRRAGLINQTPTPRNDDEKREYDNKNDTIFSAGHAL